MMTRDLFSIPAGVNRPTAHISRLTPQAMSNEGAIDARTRCFNSVVAFEIPSDSLWSEMIGASEMKDLLDDLWW